VSATVVGKRVELRVMDTGIGIKAADQAHLFDRFYRADAARVTDTHAGAGLGLSIVKAIVEAHQATIEVVSEVGRGTTIIVSFPV
jgi:two-component system sensor histidine kinase ResE